MSHQPKRNFTIGLSNSKTNTHKNNSYNFNNLTNSNQNITLKRIKSDLIHSDQQTYYDRKLQEGTIQTFKTSLLTFGSNEMGQLGKEVDINNPYSTNPVILTKLSNDKIISISAGDGHSVCVSSDGVVYAWGASACGQLGLEDNESMPRDSEGYPYQPIPIPIRLMSNVRIKEVACGDAHSLAMSKEGKVFSWGGAGCGQLGHSNINEMPKDSDNCPYQPYPRLIETLKNLIITQIACGKAHSLAIDSTGSLFTWGAGACGQLGVEDIQTLPVDDDGYPYQPVPKCLKSLKNSNIVLGVCGDVHTLILNDKGELFSFGGGSFGQLGLGAISKMPLDSDRYPYMPIPTKIDSLNEYIITNIACGDSHSMAVDSEGRLFAWGAAACGQLGIDNLILLTKDGDGNPYQPEPKFVTFFENFKVLSVSCGEAHSLVLCEYGIVFSFGGSSCGQLGYPDENKFNINNNNKLKINDLPLVKFEKPRLITSLLGENIIKTSCGGVHNIILADSFPSLNYNLFLMLKNEKMIDLELIFEFKSIYKLNFLCHKFILISKSNYFYRRLVTNKEEINVDRNINDINSTCNLETEIDSEINNNNLLSNSVLTKLIINGNYNPICLKTIIEYLYLDDISFLNHIEDDTCKNYSLIDILTDYLKISSLFELKYLKSEIENKIRINLLKYSEALNSINLSTNNNFDSNEDEETSNLNSNENQYKGLFFLPNGNALFLFNEEIIENVMKNSLIINFPNLSINNSNNIPNSPSKNLTQKSMQSETYKNQNRLINKSSNKNNNNIEIKILGMITENEEINKTEDKQEISKNSENLDKNIIECSKSIENSEVLDILIKFKLIDQNNLTFSNLNNFEYLKLFNKEETSDITIKIEDQILYTHKVILVNSSKYFDLMLSENLKENNKNEIIITEYSAEEFLYFLSFLYSDSLNLDLDLEKSLVLIKAADMFQVDSLKFKLENFLAKNLEIENSAKIFKFASFYNYERLKKISLAFIHDNYEKVIETSEFEDLHRESMLEIIRFCKSR